MKAAFSILLASLALLVGAGPVYAQDEVEAEFKVTLSGAEEVAPVQTSAFGKAEFELKGLTLKFEVEVGSIVNVAASHIHVGAAGTNGPVIIFLYGPGPLFTAEDEERLSRGVLTPANLIPRPAQGINTWDDFVNAFLSGNTYVNVHTSAHPGGEIRAQIV